MKKVLLLATLFAFSGQFVFATSGACSSHGGVSCASGPDSDGSVICNDGWTDSSVFYESVSMCQTQSSCPSYLPQNEYDSLVSAYNGIIRDAQQKMQASSKLNQSLCVTTNNQKYQRAQESYANCIKYKKGLYNLHVQGGGSSVDRSQDVNCGPAPSIDTEVCKEIPNEADLKYLKIISEAQREIGCLKILPVQKPLTDFESEITKIAQDVKSRTPKQRKEDNEEICKKNKEFERNDPKGFEKYKEDLALLGIPATDCNEVPVVPVNTPSDSSGSMSFAQWSQERGMVSMSTVSTQKKTFWSKIGNFIKGLIGK